MRIASKLGGVTIAIVLLSAAPLRAQDVAAAEALFNKGLAAMKAENFKEGCAALAESQRLDPRPGTLFTLAECRAREGAIATSVALFEDYLQLYARLKPAEQSKQKGRNKVATERKAELEPHVPKLTLRLPAGAPAGTEVIRDEVLLKGASLDTALPVDPGEHEISTRAPGGPEKKIKITIAKDEQKTVDLTVLPVPPPEKPPPPPPKEETSIRRPLVYVTGGLGVAGLVLGGVMGGLTLDKKGIADQKCPELHCNLEGSNAVRDGRTFGLVSTIGFAVGGAGVAAAAILFFTEPRPAPGAKTGLSLRPVLAADGENGFIGASGAW